MMNEHGDFVVVPFGFLDLTNGKIFLLSRLRSAFGCGLSQFRKIVDGDLPLFLCSLDCSFCSLMALACTMPVISMRR